jgi:cytochrome bd-type quinol oxidase subunit 2
MIEISLEYWNKLADQIIMISSLLAGFSITIVANFLVSETNNRLMRTILKSATIAASFFLIALFSMTRILMMTTEGFPFKVSGDDLIFPKLVGGISFFIGIISILTIISLSGWTKSKNVGIFTTALGILTLILIFYMLT